MDAHPADQRFIPAEITRKQNVIRSKAFQSLGKNLVADGHGIVKSIELRQGDESEQVQATAEDVAVSLRLGTL